MNFATRSHEDAQAHSNRQMEATGLFYCGLALEQLARWHEAADAYQKAMQLYADLALEPALADAQAGLARVALVQNDWRTAQRWVEEILVNLPLDASTMNDVTVGQDEPFLIYLTCHQLLRVTGDLRAEALLKAGVEQLWRYADAIADDTLRTKFLEAVLSHRTLYQAQSVAIGLHVLNSVTKGDEMATALN
ncbi:MAG: hypothetical protein R2932_44385 [Caldilineaceae bacterium]